MFLGAIFLGYFPHPLFLIVLFSRYWSPFFPFLGFLIYLLLLSGFGWFRFCVHLFIPLFWVPHHCLYVDVPFSFACSPSSPVNASGFIWYCMLNSAGCTIAWVLVGSSCCGAVRLFCVFGIWVSACSWYVRISGRCAWLTGLFCIVLVASCCGQFISFRVPVALLVPSLTIFVVCSVLGSCSASWSCCLFLVFSPPFVFPVGLII